MEPRTTRKSELHVRLSGGERADLERLAAAERLPMAQVVRRLIWRAVTTTDDS